jgi:hypothetical protein
MTSTSLISWPQPSEALRPGSSPTALSTSVMAPHDPVHDVVVVVPDPRLVASHGARRLEAPHQTGGGGQRVQHVADA